LTPNKKEKERKINMADKEAPAAPNSVKDQSSVKGFLHAWCQKRGKTPGYFCRPTGPAHRPRFLCELRVPGVVYTACGNSTTKKSAETNAARDFVEYLVRTGEVQPSEVPVRVETRFWMSRWLNFICPPILETILNPKFVHSYAVYFWVDLKTSN
jgi:hypothetical protein